MANRNNYRVVLTNDFLGVSKELSAPTRYELNKKIENIKMERRDTNEEK